MGCRTTHLGPWGFRSSSRLCTKVSTLHSCVLSWAVLCCGALAVVLAHIQCAAVRCTVTGLKAPIVSSQCMSQAVKLTCACVCCWAFMPWCCMAGHVRHVDIGGCSFLAPPTHQLAGTNGISSSSAPAPRPKSPKLKSAKKGKTQPAAASSAAKAGKSTNSKAKSATGKQKQTDTAQNTGSEGSAGPRGVSATPACALRKIGGQAGCAASAFDVREPDGVYTLDLALPPDRQVSKGLWHACKALHVPA